jgi:uncharacterized membrane protein
LTLLPKSKYIRKGKNMTPLYKEGLYWLILLAVTACVYAILAVSLGPTAACGAFGLLGIAGLQPLLYRRQERIVLWDERDTQIAHKAVIIGFAVFWLAFSLGIMGLWAVVYYGGSREVISIHVLPNIVLCGTILFASARAIAIVVQYRLQNAGKGE